MKRHTAKTVGQIIEEAIDASGTRGAFDRQRICFLWAEVVGPAITRQTIRRWVSGDVLHVAIQSASLRNDLQFLTPRLIERLNRAAGKEIITRIVFH